MRKFFAFAAVLAVICFSAPAFATNGDNIIGVGAVSRSMGGVGTADPQDAITAVFGNPAAMCYIPCQSSEVDFAASLFYPHVKANVTTPLTGTISASSNSEPYAFPAIGIYTPITPDLKFGLAAYGVSGLGVDYKGTGLANVGTAFDKAFSLTTPLPGTDIKTDLQIMKFAPNLAYRILPNLSVGAAFQLNWAQLDLGDGSSHTFGYGTQLGIIYKPIDPLSIGVTWQSAQRHTFKNIYNFNPPSLAAFGLANTDNTLDNLTLEQPNQVSAGVGYDIIPNKLMMEVDGRWYDWADASGYKDFDWKDQYIVAVGIQEKPLNWLALRLGYNYGNNPVKDHPGWNAFGTTYVEGTPTNTFFYEYLRTIGFPAIVEHHLTAGVGINLSKKVSLNLGYMHAFGNTISETSAPIAALGGQTITLQSKLDEDSYEFGLNVIF